MKRLAVLYLSLISALAASCGGEKPAATQAPATAPPPATAAAVVRPKPTEPAVAGMDAVLAAYLDEADRLASDTFESTAATKLPTALAAVVVDPPPSWLSDLRQAATVYAAAADLSSARRAFDAVSTNLIAYAEAHETAGALHLVHCPMVAAPLGGSWLQRGDSVRNPWYGAGMLSCGEKKW